MIPQLGDYVEVLIPAPKPLYARVVGVYSEDTRVKVRTDSGWKALIERSQLRVVNENEHRTRNPSH